MPMTTRLRPEWPNCTCPTASRPLLLELRLEQLLPAHDVLVVLDALVLTDPLVRAQPERLLHMPRLGEDLGVFHRDVVDDGVVGIAAVALRHAQLLAVDGPHARQPRLVVEADHVHHQRVALPARYRVAEIRRL